MQLTLPDPLELENTDEILSFTAGPADLALWPLIRSAVLARLTRALRTKLEGTSPCGFDAVQMPQSRWLTDLYNLRHISTWPRNKDILYLSNKSPRQILNGRPYNHWEQPTAELLGERTLFTSTVQAKHFFNIKSNISFYDASSLYKTINRIARRCPKKTTHNATTKLRSFLSERIEMLYGKLIHPSEFYEILEKIPHRLYVASIEHYMAKLAIRKSSIRLIIISTAAYGSHIGFQTAASEEGIPTAELQHGEISPSHYAYNIAPSIISKANIQRYMPQYILSYGNYWHKNIRTTSTLRAIGNPFFSMMFPHSAQQYGKGILFALSDDYESFKSLISNTCKAFPKNEIIVRPHPHCRTAFKRSSIAQLDGYTLDTNPNIYDTLRRTSAVISTGSTVLFEAAALGQRCFLVPSKMLNTHEIWEIFETITSPDDLVSKLSHHECGKINDTDKESIFSKNWESNYTEFVSQACP